MKPIIPTNATASCPTIPSEVYPLIQERCRKNRKYRKLLAAEQAYRVSRNFALMMNERGKQVAMEIEEYNQFLKEVNSDSITVEELRDGLTDEQRWQVIHKTNFALLCCDWIESLTLEIHEILADELDGGRIVLYDKLLRMGKEATKIRQAIVDKGDMEYQCEFGDMADDLRLQTETQVKLMTKRNIKARHERDALTNLEDNVISEK